MTNDSTKLLLTVAEAAAQASVSRTVAYDLTGSGVWPTVRIGRSVRVPMAGLLRWIEANTTQMDRKKQRAVASLGGIAAHKQGKAHEWTSEEARAAGRKGGAVSRGGRGRQTEQEV